MDIHAQKLLLIEQLLKVKNQALIEKIKALLDFAEKETEKGELTPMSLEQFYQKILNSEEAIAKGDVISQAELREKINTWRSS